MISLAGRDILHAWGKFVFTGIGLGLLIGVTLTMAGVYRGMVDDAQVLLDNSAADLWVVQKDTLGPYAEPSNLPDDTWRAVANMPGVASASNVTYLTMQVAHAGGDTRALVTGIANTGPGSSGWPLRLIAGRQVSKNHYEAVADIASGFKLGERIQIRRNSYLIVGLTQRMVSSSGDPMIFIPLLDAQQAQFLKSNDAIAQSRRRIKQNPIFNNPRNPEVLDAVLQLQESNTQVNAVLVQIKAQAEPKQVAEDIRRWLRLQVYDREQMEGILVGKLIATSARQILMFLVILAVVSAAIVAFIIYTLTMGKIREIAVLKLIGTHNQTIVSMIIQQALALGVIGFIVGKIAATVWAPFFPKYVLLITQDTITGLIAVLCMCVLASFVAIYAALRVNPADAVGG
ncbi:FtsX-like permease family protein [Pseudomonas sp. C27(2019)]|uniref:ABC transporter permease n=1 Tax=Pseudomonas sp. C27(2019) TaxID=2604941 RepID=UPI00124492B2|nr:ABC transporter permease [Pseudomonas sp. C27(2019)]QEY57859.1 FtsX-like permease family protein [Pseudomonas sp. C27(2019)]